MWTAPAPICVASPPARSRKGSARFTVTSDFSMTGLSLKSHGPTISRRVWSALMSVRRIELPHPLPHGLAAAPLASGRTAVAEHTGEIRVRLSHSRPARESLRDHSAGGFPEEGLLSFAGAWHGFNSAYALTAALALDLDTLFPMSVSVIWPIATCSGLPDSMPG